MPNGTQFDMSQVGQDPGFRSATLQDKFAFLSAHDPDFAAASIPDKMGYIDHLLGNDKPQLNTANQKGFWGTVGEKLKGLIPQDPTEGRSFTDPKFWLSGGVETPPMIKQATRPLPQDLPGGTAGRAIYRGATTLSPLVPFANPEAMEQASAKGDTGAVAAETVMPIAAAVGPMALREGVRAVAPGVSRALESSAAKNYEDVLNPTRIDTKYQTAKIMPQLVKERPTAFSREGLAEKAATQAEAAGQEVEQAASGLQGSMKTQPVIDGLENLRQKYQVNRVSLRPEVNSAIDTLQDQLRKISQPGEVAGGAEGPGEATISNQDVLRARRILDDAVAEVGGYQGRPLSDVSLANIRKATANSFREELGNASPDLAAVNAKFHFWNTLSDVLDATIQRKTGQVNALPKMETVIAGAGGLAKSGISGAVGYGAAMNALGKLVRSTGWRTVSAATKGAIADALSNGQFDKVLDLTGKGGQAGAAAEQSAPENNSGPIASLLDYDPVQARQALANPITQHLINALNPNVADAAIKKFGLTDTRKYFRGRNA